MADFRSIEIDFDVHQKIETERKSFAETPNNVLRRLLGLGVNAPTEPPPPSPSKGLSWSGGGLTLPHGTLLRMKYNGQQYEGEISDGHWIIDGKVFNSPSGAASGVARTKKGKKTRLDGWIYWEARRPEDTTWENISNIKSEGELFK